MSDKKALFMTITPPTVMGATGWVTYIEGATQIIGFCTALVGFAVGVCSLIWWIRRLTKK